MTDGKDSVVGNWIMETPHFIACGGVARDGMNPQQAGPTA